MSPINRRARLISLLAPASLFLLAIIVFLPAINGQFIWDDLHQIPENRLLRDAGGLWRIWTTVTSISSEEHYWPLLYTTLWLEWHAWGEATTGYHIVNLLLNAAKYT
ncbi:hypothetical protein LLG95_18730, partial [bacterium]|nr:hypothetical protein [bacterium]